jgi:hypothetical protein
MGRRGVIDAKTEATMALREKRSDSRARENYDAVMFNA